MSIEARFGGTPTPSILYTVALLFSVSTMEFGGANAWMVASCVVDRVGAGVNKYIFSYTLHTQCVQAVLGRAGAVLFTYMPAHLTSRQTAVRGSLEYVEEKM